MAQARAHRGRSSSGDDSHAYKLAGGIKAGQIINDICAREDFVPTFAAAAGEADLVEKTRKGFALNGKSYKVHLDGHNLLPFLPGLAHRIFLIVLAQPIVAKMLESCKEFPPRAKAASLTVSDAMEKIQ